MYSLWEGSFCPHFLFLHTSFLSQCTQACTPVLVGVITCYISKPNMKEQRCIVNFFMHLVPFLLKRKWTGPQTGPDTPYSMTIPTQTNLTLLKQFSNFKGLYLTFNPICV